MLATLEPEGVEQSRANQDGKFFADEPTNIIVMVEEVELPVADPRPKFNPGLGSRATGAVKVMQYIMRTPRRLPPGLPSALAPGSRRGHGGEPLCPRHVPQGRHEQALQGQRQRRRRSGSLPMVDPPVYDLVVSFTLDSMEQVGAFRQYFDAMPESDLTFADWSESFFLYVRPVRIIDDAPPKE